MNRRISTVLILVMLYIIVSVYAETQNQNYSNIDAISTQNPSNNIYTISTQNPSNNIYTISTQNTTKGLKFIIVGDPQINSTTFEGVERLKQVVSFVNRSHVDFIVFEGDMTDDGTNKSNDIVKDILKNLKKPYYVVVGNHDLHISSKVFESYYGPMEHIEFINGYQLLFIGMKDVHNKTGGITKLDWSFDFSKANKSVPTLVFIHGPVKKISLGCLYCRFQKDIFAYGYSMNPELEKFTNLIGVYSGHVHYDSERIVDGTRYVTVNGLINIIIDYIPIVHASNKVGYSIIKNNDSYYELIPYI